MTTEVGEPVPDAPATGNANPTATTNQPGFLVSPTYSSVPLTNEAKVSALKAQLEYYFSARNLTQDKFLTDQMNADRYVPVDLVAGFPKVKKLTSSRDLLIAVMRGCKNLALDETEQMVRPVTRKLERNTIIIRDLPANTPLEQVQALFTGKTPTNVRADIGDTWFVMFENEEACLEAAKALENQRFNGNPIRFRVKSESVLRGDMYGGAPSSPDVYAAGDPNATPGDVTRLPQAAVPGDAAAFYSLPYPMAGNFVPFAGGGFVQPAAFNPQFMGPLWPAHPLQGGVYSYMKRGDGRRGGVPVQQVHPMTTPARKDAEPQPQGAEPAAATVAESSMPPATIHVPPSATATPSSPVIGAVPPANFKKKMNQGGPPPLAAHQLPRGAFPRYAQAPRLMQNFQPPFTFNTHASKAGYPMQYPPAVGFQYPQMFQPQFQQGQFGAFIQSPPQQPATQTGQTQSPASTQSPAQPSSPPSSSSPLQQPLPPPAPTALPAQQLMHMQQMQMQLQFQQLQLMQQQQQQLQPGAAGKTVMSPLQSSPMNGATHPDMLRRPHPVSALSLLAQPPLVPYPGQGPAQPLFYYQPMMAPMMMPQQMDRRMGDMRRDRSQRNGKSGNPNDPLGAERRSPQLQPELGPEHFPALPLKASGTRSGKKDGEAEGEPKGVAGTVVSSWGQPKTEAETGATSAPAEPVPAPSEERPKPTTPSPAPPSSPSVTPVASSSAPSPGPAVPSGLASPSAQPTGTPASPSGSESNESGGVPKKKNSMTWAERARLVGKN